MTSKRVRKSSQDKMLFGVAGGLADYFNIDPVLVRLAFVLATFASGVGLIAYIVLAIIMPKGETEASSPREVLGENLQSLPREAAEAAHRVREAVRPSPAADERGTAPSMYPQKGRRSFGLGIILIGLGTLLLLNNLGMFRWFSWGRLWPVILILLGVAIILGRLRRG